MGPLLDECTTEHSMDEGYAKGQKLPTACFLSFQPPCLHLFAALNILLSIQGNVNPRELGRLAEIC